MQRLAIRLQRGTRWGRSVGAVDLAQGFADALREELDLRIEARNMTAVAAATAARDEGVRVPAPYEPYCGERVLVMQFFDGRPLLAAAAGPARRSAAGACPRAARQPARAGHARRDLPRRPAPGQHPAARRRPPRRCSTGASVGRIDAGLRGALQRLLLALDRGDPVMVTDSLLDVVDRPEELDEPRLERALGRFLARYFAAGVTPDMRMFTDLFRIVTDFGLSVPPEIAAVFRALATIEGTLTQLAPGFDIVAEARRFGGKQLAAHLHVDGARPGRSERRITVGEDYATHVEGLHRAMYVALGHIDDPQLVPGGTVTGRYAGSLIPIDFGEAVEEKQALLVTVADGDVTVTGAAAYWAAAYRVQRNR